MDASFVRTYSRKEEDGSLGWNEYKQGIGFKSHALIDAETGVLIALIIKDGLTHESQVAIPLLKRARPWLKRCGYVLADKGYDDVEIIGYIAKSLKAKAGISIKETNRAVSEKRNQLTAEERIKGGYTNWKLKSQGGCGRKSIHKKRTEIERFFSTLKRSFHLGQEKTRGIKAFLENTCLSRVCFMLRRLRMAGVI